MQPCDRQLTDPVDGFLLSERYLVHDRDTTYTQAFDALLKDSGVEPIVLPPRSPNLNAHIEQFVLSIRQDVLHHTIIMGEKSLRVVPTQYLTHYCAERNHQGLDNQLIVPPSDVGSCRGHVRRRARLGVLLNDYDRDAA
jgi:transposase InsO family protein